MAEIIGHIGRAQTLTAELSTPQTITGSLCGGAAHGIPTGGEPGQGLIKVSDADYDVKWMSILPEDTASGAVASFPDGADDLPMGVVVDIDPVQDLNGYENPWPAGGGVNKWDEVTEIGVLSPDGTVSGSSRLVTSYIPVVAGNTYAVHIPVSSRGRGAFYNSNKEFLSYYGDFPSSSPASVFPNEGVITQVPDGYYFVFIAPENAAYLRYNLVVGYGTTYKNDVSFNYPDSNHNYWPTANLCPISGHTGAKVTRTGRNLVEDSLVGYNIIANGTFEQTSSFTMQIAQVKKGVQYTKTAGDDYFVGGYFTEKPTPSSVTYNNSRIVELANTFTAPIDGYVVFRTASSFATPQLELGSTAHAYEPYTAVTHEIPFSTEVYGGTLNVETGELVVDRKTDIADGSTIAIQGIYGNGTAYTRPIDGMYNDSAYAYQRVARILSDKLKASPFISIASNQYAVAHSGGNRAVFNIPTCTTEAEYNAWLSENRPQIVYYLATPITLTLDPTEIRSLLGDNNVWSDTGNVSVTYKADTKKYIDKKISAAVAAMS